MARGRPRKIQPTEVVEEVKEVAVESAPPADPPKPKVYKLKVSYNSGGVILPAGSVVSLDSVPADYMEHGLVYETQ